MKKLIIGLLTLLSFSSYAQRISDLPAATTLGGTEVVAGVQGGVTKKISINQISTATATFLNFPGSLGTALQQLRVNAGATALEYFTPTITNIYTSDGTLTGSRVLDGDGNDLSFENIGNFSTETLSEIYFGPGTDFRVSATEKASITAVDSINFTAPIFKLGGLAPSSPTTEFFRGDGTWAVPGGSGGWATTDRTVVTNPVIDANGSTIILSSGTGADSVFLEMGDGYFGLGSLSNLIQLEPGSGFSWNNATEDIIINAPNLHATTSTGSQFDMTSNVSLGAALDITISAGTGGSGKDISLSATAGGIIATLAAPLTINGNPGTAGYVLQSNGAGAAPTWVAPSGVSDGDKGDITVSSSGSVWTVDAGAVSGTDISATYQDWTPTFTGFSGTPTFTARYTVVGKICFAYISMLTATSNATNFEFTLPVAAANTYNQYTVAYITNNGSGATGGLVSIVPNTNNCVVLRDGAGTAWTASGTKLVRVVLTYETL